jgi:hypothetical protein
MMERRSISIDEGLNRKVLDFRAFFMAEGIDVDFTRALNFLAALGVDELERSGFDPRTMDLFGGVLWLDEDTARALPERWQEWRAQRTGYLKKQAELKGGKQRAKPVSGVRKALQEKESVTSFCVKCKRKREMRDVEEVRFKNNKTAYRGVCTVCGAKMVKFYH